MGNDVQGKKNGEEKKNGRSRSVVRTLGRVLAALGIWLALAVVAAAIVAVVPNVGPCLQAGVAGCGKAAWGVLNSGSGNVRWTKPGLTDWVILAVALIVAVRIMFPPEDLTPPAETTASAG